MDLGRNDPCHCGSGKKYKKCCLQKDVAAAPPPLDFAYESNLVLRGKVTEKLDRLLAEVIDSDDLEEFLEDYWTAPYLGLKEVEALRAHKESREIIEFQIPVAMRNAFLVDDRMPARFFLEETPERFTSQELSFLRDLADAKLTYIQLREYFPESGYTMAEDLFDGKPYKIFDKGLSKTAVPHAIIAARLIPMPAKAGYVFEMISNIIVLPGQKETLMDVLIEEARDFAAAEGDKEPPTVVTAVDIHAVLAEDPFIFYWVEMLFRYQGAFPGKPRMTTTDGEEIVFIKARFACEEADAFAAALATQKAFSRNDGVKEKVFHWFSQKKVLLGTITVDAEAGQLLVETNSRERFKKWEKKLKSLGDVRFLDKHEESFEAAGSRMPEGGLPGEEISEEQMAELAPQIEAHFAEMWLKEKIPMLGGKTPIEAKATPKGRKQLKELFDYMENQEARLPKGFARGGFDLDAMKARLGLADR